MSDKVLFDPEKLSIVEYKLLKGQIESPEDFLVDTAEGHYTDNKYSVRFNLDDNLARTDFIVEIKTESKGKNKEEASGSFHFMYVFNIKNLKELAIPEKDNETSVELDPMLASSLASITYSTSRGILLTRLQGTALQEYILPVINTLSLMLSADHKILQHLDG